MKTGYGINSRFGDKTFTLKYPSNRIDHFFIFLSFFFPIPLLFFFIYFLCSSKCPPRLFRSRKAISKNKLIGKKTL